MTGPGPGKLKVTDAKIYLALPTEVEELKADVYIHVKGYSRARVTHLDIEHPELNEIFPPSTTGFYPLIGTGHGFIIKFSKLIRGLELEVVSKLLASYLIFYGEKTWVYVGVKSGGIFIGFKKVYVLRLEDIAIRIFKVYPKRRST